MTHHSEPLPQPEAAREASVARYRRAEEALWLQSVGALPAERSVRLGRGGMRVRLLEHGDGPTLLFVHGGPSAASTWAPLVGRLSGFRCVLLERPGCGLSDGPARPVNGVRAYLVQLLADTIRTLDEPPAAIVASSFGSFAALAFAAAQPSQTLPLIHMGCPALVPGSHVPLPLLLPCLPLLGPLLRRIDPPNLRATQAAFRQMGHADSLTRREGMVAFFAWYTALMRETPTRANEQALFGRVRPGDALRQHELARLTTPMTWLWGADDRFGGPAIARALVALLPHAHISLLPDSGHLPWLDAPEQAAALVREAFRHN